MYHMRESYDRRFVKRYLNMNAAGQSLNLSLEWAAERNNNITSFHMNRKGNAIILGFDRNGQTIDSVQFLPFPKGGIVYNLCNGVQ